MGLDRRSCKGWSLLRTLRLDFKRLASRKGPRFCTCGTGLSSVCRQAQAAYSNAIQENLKATTGSSSCHPFLSLPQPTPLGIDRIRARGRRPHQHIALTRNRIRALLKLEHFRTAIFVDNNRFHLSSPGSARKVSEQLSEESRRFSRTPAWASRSLAPTPILISLAIKPEAA
jgi:hypothetical protein